MVKETLTTKTSENKPVRGHIRRLAGFTLDQTFRVLSLPVRMIPGRLPGIAGGRPAAGPRKQLERGTGASLMGGDDTARLAGRGRTLLHALRENFGDSLDSGGLVMRPPTDGGRDILVRATTHDTAVAHSTEAVIDIAQGERVGRLAITATEPTVGAKHLDTPVEPVTSVQAAGSVNFIEAAETLHAVEAAVDSGEITPYQPITG